MVQAAGCGGTAPHPRPRQRPARLLRRWVRRDADPRAGGVHLPSRSARGARRSHGGGPGSASTRCSGGMNRTDRLYAMAEVLRASAPRARTASELAERFEVSVRTIERDISALQQSGVPIWATPGPGGGYSVDPEMSLPPLNLTADEATAVAVAASGPIPFGDSA